MQPHYSHSSRETATPSSGTSLLAPCKGVPPPPTGDLTTVKNYTFCAPLSVRIKRGFIVSTVSSFTYRSQ